MRQKNNQNELTLKGVVKTLQKKLYEDGTLYEFEIGIPRNSGYEDIIKVVYDPERLFPRESEALINVGETVAVFGKLAVFPTYDETGKRHSHLRAFAENFTRGAALPEYFNEVKFDGIIAQDVHRRVTPLGRTLSDFIVDNCDGQKHNYIVCLAWGRKADMLKLCTKGEQISIKGRFQSREYNKYLDENTIEIRTAYEISIGSFSITVSEA